MKNLNKLQTQSTNFSKIGHIERDNVVAEVNENLLSVQQSSQRPRLVRTQRAFQTRSERSKGEVGGAKTRKRKKRV